MEGEVSLIAAVKEEEISLYHTGRSLICTIGANGHIWPKPLGKESRDNDVELEIFTPVHGGYLFRRKKDKEGSLEHYLDKQLTESQQRCASKILTQKEKLRELLGTIMVSPQSWKPAGDMFKNHPVSSRMNFTDQLDSINVIKCGPASSSRSYRGNFYIAYDDVEFVFKLIVANPDGLHSLNGFVPFNTSVLPSQIWDCWTGSKDLFPRYKFYVARLEYGAFNMWGAGLRYGEAANTFRQTVRIMWGEYDFFEVFDVDEALLLLEEYRNSESESELRWTLALAQNKIARNLIRLTSNNPDLFKGLVK